MEFKRSKVSVNVYGKVFEISKPTVGQIEKMTDEAVAMDESQKGKQALKFLVELGIDNETVKGMEIGHALELIEFLTSTGKKN